MEKGDVKMTTVDEVKRNVLMEDDVFKPCYNELGEFRETCFLAKRLAERMLTQGCLAALEELCNLPADGACGIAAINTYPFGSKTREILPEFFGVCAGDRRLYGVFKAIERQIAAYKELSQRNADWMGISKSITVFTDKWDARFLKEYEELFLDAILNYNVSFYFYLVTDYGITRIPFMHRNQLHRFKDMFHGQQIGSSVPLKDLLKIYDMHEARLEISTYSSFDVYHNESSNYCFDFTHLVYEYRDKAGGVKHGRIQAKDAHRFITAAIALQEAGGLNEAGRWTGGKYYILKFAKFGFDWANRIDDSATLAKKMEAALMEMIDNLQ